MYEAGVVLVVIFATPKFAKRLSFPYRRGDTRFGRQVASFQLVSSWSRSTVYYSLLTAPEPDNFILLVRLSVVAVSTCPLRCRELRLRVGQVCCIIRDCIYFASL